MEFNPELCDLCDSPKYQVLLDIKGRIMTSDRQIINGRLKKIQCSSCGLVRNGLPKTEIQAIDYKNNYGYNVSEKGDVFFFSKSGPQERSSQIFDRILSVLGKRIDEINSIAEIGCGYGNLLEKFSQHYPQKTIIGFELNDNARRIGIKKGLDIRRYDNITNYKADLIISYTVIEHTPSPKHFMMALSKMLNPDGLIVLGQPHQNKIFYDIFFLDHLYHFSTEHVKDIGLDCGLIQIKKSIGTGSMDSASMHLFKKSRKKTVHSSTFYKTKVKESIIYYTRIFKKINRYIKQNTGQNFAVLGLGEMFSLFYTYTDLGKTKIMYGIDDFPKQNHEFSFPIISTKDIEKYKIDTILFCINPNYYKIVLKKFKSEKYNILTPFSKGF